MKAIKTALLILVLLPCLLSWHCSPPPPAEETGQADDTCCAAPFPTLTGDYLGQPAPGIEPVLFAPGIVSTGLYERDVVITPDGNEFYFGILGRNHSALIVSHRVDGRWTEPKVAGFSTNQAIFDLEPHITPDGSRFLFLSTRPNDDADPSPGWHDQDIWAMDRTESGWSEPYNFGPPVNTEAPEFFPSTTRTETIYFTREVEGQGGKRSLIHRCRMVDGEYQPAEALPAEVNAGDTQYNSFIDPDERFLIFGMSGREDAIGPADYYISFRDENDVWTGPVNMGGKFNTPTNSVVSAWLTHDGKYLFFASSRSMDEEEKSPDRSWRQFQERHGQPRNGNSDIYWVDASIIETLRPE